MTADLGYGELFYGNGAKYRGEFKFNKRHGRGIFCDKDGTEYYGNFHDDEKDGEFIVKLIVPIEEIGQPNYEIRIGSDSLALSKPEPLFRSVYRNLR